MGKNEHLKTYTALGIDFQEGDTECIAECPFCGKQKLYINVEEGFFDCKVCGCCGNKYTFMQHLYDFFYKETTDSHYKHLSSLRGDLDWRAFKNAELAFDPRTDEWWIPVKSDKGSIINIRIWNPQDNILMHTSGCSAALYGLERLTKKNHKVMICEGEWDAIAMEWLLLQEKVKDIDILAVPGASTFKTDWAKYFNDKIVYLLYDNDKAGKDGCERAIKQLRTNARTKEISKIVWPESTPDKFDIRDWVTRNKDRTERAWAEFGNLLEQVSTHKSRESSGIVRTTFNEVIKDFREHIYLPKDCELGLLLGFSVIFSNRIPGDPLWLFLIGPPGCIARDARVRINRAGRSWEITMEELYYCFKNQCGTNGKEWDRSIPTMIQYRNEEDGTIRLTELLDVVSSGVKKVLRITTEDGKEIEATEDHRFLTDKGWKKAGELRTGRGKLYVTGEQAYGLGQGGGRYRSISGLKNHPKASKKDGSLLEHRLTMEGYLNGLSLAAYIMKIREGNLSGITFLTEDQVVHHKNEDTLDNRLENLELLTRSEHSRLHDNTKNVLYKTKLVKIKRVESAGVKQTFDICVHEPHNFICNDFVVHNSGKTLILQSLSDVDATHYESSLSPKTLVSGFKTNDGSDPSLLPRIIGKTLIIKEYTEIMAMSGADQDYLFAVLRGAYDGRVERTYPHGITRIYPEPGSEHKTCHFSIVAGVTNAIHGDNRAALGERFLKYQMFPDNYDPINQIKSAVGITLKQELPEFELRESASAFIEHKIKQLEVSTEMPDVPAWIQEQLIGLAQVVSIIRAMVARKQGELLYRPSPEIGTRLSKQLIKLSQVIAFTLDKDIVDEEVYKYVRRVAMDTCYGYARDVMMTITKYHPRGVGQRDIEKEAKLGQSTCRRCLEDLFELGAIEFESMKTGLKGQPPRLWKLSTLMEKLFNMAKIMDERTIGSTPEFDVSHDHREKKRIRGKTTYKRYVAKRS